MMTLRLKILFGFLILALMLLVAGIWSVYSLNSIGSSVQQLLDDNYKSTNAANMMLEGLERQDSAVLLLLLGKWEEGRDILISANDLFQDGFETAAGNITIPGEKEHIERIRSSYAEYRSLWQRPIVDTEREGNIAWYFNEVHATFLGVKHNVNELKRINEESLYETASDLKRRAERAVVPGTVATIAALVFSIVFTYLVNRFMIGPIVEITQGIEQFRRQGKHFDVEVNTRDEIENLAQAVTTLCSDVSARRTE